ncbi:MAG: serine protease [Calditrichaeota bacterium]|nr:MAG: serine protease [Calditrichota bacterium]MBL1203757.1 serine protease [Calditrichota bacterium]NOG43588.1 trypsin-like peptidase domain-containing protein [Calditrichota bacterium]
MSSLKLLLFIVLFLFSDKLFSQNFLTSSFNEAWLESVISIEKSINGNYHPIGTGFLINTPNNHVAIVTAKHVVLDENRMPHKKIGFRVKTKKGKSIVYPENFAIDFTGNKWFYSKKFDIACHIFAWDTTADISTIPYKNLLVSKDLQTGAPLLIPGFPMGLRSADYPDPIVRRGSVALIMKDKILADALVFGGNSGSPVLYVPTLKVDNKTLSSPLFNQEMVIGLVSSYIPYTDVAISKQTKRTRITFEENSGLCNIIPAEAIIELLNRKDLIELEKTLK